MSLRTVSPTILSVDTGLDDTRLMPSEQFLEDHLATVCTQVVTAFVNDSVQRLSALMLEHHVPCLIIINEFDPSDTLPGTVAGKLQSLNPVGLVAEREIVQYQVSEPKLHSVCAQTIMRPLALCVLPPKTSLLLAYQILTQQDLEYGVVEWQGELLGLLSRASLLQAFNPVVMQGLLEDTRKHLSRVTDQLVDTQEQLHREQLAYQQAQLDFSAAKVQSRQQSDERTAELAEMNIQLKKDLRKRKRVEEALKQTLKTLQSAQIQVIQNERMAGLGHFVAGVAHEINNPVNFIHGNLKPAQVYAEELLTLVNYYQTSDPILATQPETEKLEEIDIAFLSEDFPKLLNSMRMGTERIREIVKSLRNFSRLDEAEMKPVDIQEGIENTLMLLANRFKAQPGQQAIRVVETYGQIPMVECFASQLNQVFWHLLSNAIDALRLHYTPQASGADEIGTIQIRTEKIESNRVAIYITDNGPGIPESERTKVFDPFYTTKPVGKGTGLGLSISHQIIVEKHNGNLYYHSTPGQSTEFVIELPCTLSSPYIPQQSNLGRAISC